MENSLNEIDVADLLPQKPPFVMVDAIETYNPTSLSSKFMVREDNLFIQNGYLAAAGLVENMAQSVALHTGYGFYLLQKPAPLGYIGAIKSILIKSLPKMGQTIVTTIEIIQEFGGLTLVNIASTIDGIEIASGEMKTVLAN